MPAAPAGPANRQEILMMHRRTAVGAVCLLGLALLASAWSAPAPPPQPLVNAKLTRQIKFDGMADPKTTLGDVLEYLGKHYDLTFDVNEKAFAAEASPDALKTEVGPLPAMRSVRLDAVLRKALGRLPVESGATWMLRDDRVEITTRAVQAVEVWGNYTGPHLPLVWANLDKTPLEDALRDLAEQTEFNLLMDNRAGEKGKTPVTARLRNTPLDTAVRLLADMADMRSVHLDNVLYVTTKENAAALEARIEKDKGVQPTDSADDATGRRRKGTGPGVGLPKPPAGM
jgi:hypothetical protein